MSMSPAASAVALATLRKYCVSGGDSLTLLQRALSHPFLGAAEVLATLRGARQPLVIVLATDGDEDTDVPLVRLIETAREANGTQPAHRFVAWAWHVPLKLAELAAAAHVRWVSRPSPTELLIEAVRAAAAEIRTA